MTISTQTGKADGLAPTYPLLRRWHSTYAEESRPDFVPTVVLFTDRTTGICLSGRHHTEVGQLSDSWAPHTDHHWIPCTITLTAMD